MSTARVTILPPPDYKISAKKFAMWAGIASICMFFIGMTSALLVKRAAEKAGNRWVTFDVPNWFYISTVIIVLSSVVLFIAKNYFNKGDKTAYKFLMLLSSILGTAFLICQYEGWMRMQHIGVYLGGELSHTSGSFFYVISGAHAAHIAGGLIFLFWNTIKAFRKPLTIERRESLEIVSIYWHFVDVLWIYLFILLLV